MAPVTDTSVHTPKRTPQEREADLEYIADLYVQGWTQQAIAEQLSSERSYSLSRPQIGYDLAEIRQRWLDSMLQNFDQRKSEELAKLDRVEREAWKAWEQSKEYESLITEKGQTPKGSVNLRKKRKGAGSTTYLNIILQCIQERSKICGFYAPKEIKQEGEVVVTFAWQPVDEPQDSPQAITDDGDAIDATYRLTGPAASSGGSGDDTDDEESAENDGEEDEE